MSKTCNNCGTENLNVTVPYVVHESAMARQERQIKRLWIALILAISLLFASFGMFVWYESQFETISYEQDGDGLNNVNLGEQGDLINGAEIESESQAQTQE